MNTYEPNTEPVVDAVVVALAPNSPPANRRSTVINITYKQIEINRGGLRKCLV